MAVFNLDIFKYLLVLLSQSLDNRSQKPSLKMRGKNYHCFIFSKVFFGFCLFLVQNMSNRWR